MARQQSDANTGTIIKIAALVAFGCAFLPPFRMLALYAGIAAVGIGGAILLCRVALTCEGRSVHAAGPSPTPVHPLHLDVRPANPDPFTTAELVRQLRAIDWFQFEAVVGCLYRKLGYQVTRRGGANPDGGIDLVVENGGQRMAVQCKRWKTRDVGVRPVREFLGALTDSGLARGVFVTLGGYTGAAKQLADKHGIEIVNESGLASLLERVGAASDAEILALLGGPRKVCPKCERDMVLRTAARGPGAGQKFWGCSAYPLCRYTMPVSALTASLAQQVATSKHTPSFLNRSGFSG